MLALLLVVDPPQVGDIGNGILKHSINTYLIYVLLILAIKFKETEYPGLNLDIL
jgi:hypothetical protein